MPGTATTWHDRPMTRQRRRREVLVAIGALVVVVVVAVIASASFDDDGYAPVDDLDLLHGPLDAERSPLEEQADFALRWLDPASAVDEAEIADRFSDAFLAAVPVEELVTARTDLLDDAPYSVRGVLDRRDGVMSLALLGTSGEHYVLVVAEEPGRPELIGGLTMFVERPTSDPMTAGQLFAACIAALALALGAVALSLRRPTGPVVIVAATAVAAIAQTGQLSSVGALFWIGVAAGPAALALAGTGSVILLMPPDRQRRVGIALAAAAAVLGVGPMLGVDTALIGLPGPPLRITSIEVARSLADARAVIAGVLGLVVATVAVRSAVVDRRHRAMAAGIGVADLVVMGLGISWFVGRGRFDLTASVWADIALIATAAAVTAAGFPFDTSTEVARFVIDLGDDDAPRSLEDSLRTALADPSAELLYWSTELDTYVSQHGERRSLDQLDGDRTVRPIRARDEPLAAVVHDAALTIDPQRLTAVVAAARLALEVERLQAEVRTRLSEVEASRVRIVEAGDHARRTVERDLHDGAQQRLLAVLLTLRRLERRATATPFAAELDDAANQLGVAIDELRSIARGLRPPALDHGIGAALDALAESAPIPVEVELEPSIGPLGERIETAVWFVASEAIANTVRHAAATHARLHLAADERHVTLTVGDDGCGGARFGDGTGLLRLRDRAEALGGRLDLRSEPGDGTTLTLTLAHHPEEDTRR